MIFDEVLLQVGFKYNLASRRIVEHTDSIESQPDIPNSRDSRSSSVGDIHWGRRYPGMILIFIYIRLQIINYTKISFVLKLLTMFSAVL